jgi:hypothetical protein
MTDQSPPLPVDCTASIMELNWVMLQLERLYPALFHDMVASQGKDTDPLVITGLRLVYNGVWSQASLKRWLEDVAFSCCKKVWQSVYKTKCVPSVFEKYLEKEIGENMSITKQTELVKVKQAYVESYDLWSWAHVRLFAAPVPVSGNSPHRKTADPTGPRGPGSPCVKSSTAIIPVFSK